MTDSDERLQNEIEHGRFLAGNGAGDVWNWETPAGKIRWKRRVGMLMSHIPPEMNVLELGCGTGYLTRELARTGAVITAIDISPDLLEQAQAEIDAKNVSFLQENAYDMSFFDDGFDTVIGSSVLHHLDVDRALSEVHRVLKPGGSIYFTEPNLMNPQIALQKKIPFLKRLLGDSPDETAFFRWPFGRLLSEKGFVDIEITPFDFLHPWIPRLFLPVVKPVCSAAEKIPVVNEIAGSLFIRARKMK